MGKYIFNDSGTTKTYEGVSCNDQTYIEIPAIEEAVWASNSTLVSDIASAAVIMSRTDSVAGHIVDVSSGINHLKDLAPTVHVTGQPAFADKKLFDGRSLYRRVHGVSKALSGATTFDLVIPYDNCKINSIEILWAPEELQADLKVYDTPSGTISTVPNYMLNQFGFGAGVAKDYYEEQSNYDADLIKDMKVEVSLTNPSSSTKTVCVNFVLHEIK